MSISRNMNYYYNKQYFEDLEVRSINGNLKVDIIKDINNSVESTSIANFTERNKAITKFQFELVDGSMRPWKIDGVQKFELTTLYPGLLMGTGYAHDLKNDDTIKCGFSFDYVSGLPYLPGSSLKGLLRSYFPFNKEDEQEQNKELYIKSILNKKDVDVLKLKRNIFDNGDIFLDVFPSEDNCKCLLNLEYITPHKKGPFSNPMPIRLVKVVPNVTFTYCFLLSDFKINDDVVVAKEEKLKLFKEIILDMGMGAKTNVGFGKFQEGKVSYKRIENNGQNENCAGKCAKCGKPTVMNRNTNQYFKYCWDCSKKYKEQNHR